MVPRTARQRFRLGSRPVRQGREQSLGRELGWTARRAQRPGSSPDSLRSGSGGSGPCGPLRHRTQRKCAHAPNRLWACRRELGNDRTAHHQGAVRTEPQCHRVRLRIKRLTDPARAVVRSGWQSMFDSSNDVLTAEEQQQLFAALWSKYDYHVTVLDRQQRILHVSRLFSDPLEHAIGVHVEEFVLPEQRATVRATIEEAFTHNQMRWYDAGVLVDEEVRYFRVAVIPTLLGEHTVALM